MASEKRHPYLTKEFWDNNKFWENDSHGNHELYNIIYNDIMKSFFVK